jgi:lysophospholipase L1-like esterase
MAVRHGAVATAAVLLALAPVTGCSGGDTGLRAAAPAPSPSAGAGGSAASPSAAPKPVPGPYVALGDSYTSGPRIPPQTGTPAGCERSGADYPALVAAGLGLGGADFRDVSCSGATTAELGGPQRTSGGSNPPQLDALTSATRLVTVGIGGNDAGFMDVLTRCARESFRASLLPGAGAGSGDGASAAPCRAWYAAPGGGPDDVQRRVDAAGVKVARVLGEIRRRAPRAAVYVVGYPTLFPADASACADTVGATVAPGDLAFLAEKQQQLNTMLRERAAAAGALFVDTAAASAGHDLCAGPDRRWIEPVVPAAGAAPLHPNALGERGMAEAVLAAVRS